MSLAAAALPSHMLLPANQAFGRPLFGHYLVISPLRCAAASVCQSWTLWAMSINRRDGWMADTERRRKLLKQVLWKIRGISCVTSHPGVCARVTQPRLWFFLGICISRAAAQPHCTLWSFRSKSTNESGSLADLVVVSRRPDREETENSTRFAAAPPPLTLRWCTTCNKYDSAPK